MELFNKINSTEFVLNTDLGIYTHIRDIPYNDYESTLPKIYLLGECLFTYTTIRNITKEESFPSTLRNMLPNNNVITFSFPYNTLINIFNTIKKVVQVDSSIIIFPTRVRHASTHTIFTTEEANIIFSHILEIAKIKNCKVYVPDLNNYGVSVKTTEHPDIIDKSFIYDIKADRDIYNSGGVVRKESYEYVCDRLIEMLKHTPVYNTSYSNYIRFEQLVIESQKKDVLVIKTNDVYISYIKSLLKYKDNDNKKTKGLLGGSFNPFTYGHQKLIEYAASKVDILYIVTDNLSLELPQKLRYKILKLGISHINNIILVPFSELAYSMITFGDYTVKKYRHLAGTAFYSDSLLTMDIIKILGIKYRFFGEEPECVITDKLLEDFKKINEVEGNICTSVIIPRVKVDDKIVSASRCRVLLENKEYTLLEDYIPKDIINELKLYYDNLRSI